MTEYLTCGLSGRAITTGCPASLSSRIDRCNGTRPGKNTIRESNDDD